MRHYKAKFFIGVLLITLFACTKEVGINQNLAYSDKALFDSCLTAAPFYYLNQPQTLYAGNNGAHGTFKLKFNAIAFNALKDNGKLPLLTEMPNGALVVKEIYSSGAIFQFALMYKKSGAWIWAEYQANKGIIQSVNKSADFCINCHSQSANRDYLLSFKYY